MVYVLLTTTLHWLDKPFTLHCNTHTVICIRIVDYPVLSVLRLHVRATYESAADLHSS